MFVVIRRAIFAVSMFVTVSAFGQANQTELNKTMLELDSRLFTAANRCDWTTMADMIDENLEFYHDQGGVTWGRQAFLDSLKKNLCGGTYRELVPGTFEAYPIPGYGAMEIGVHRFHHPGHEKEFPGARELGMTHFLDPGAKEWPAGEARFVQLWQLKDGKWRLTRVVSYSHK